MESMGDLNFSCAEWNKFSVDLFGFSEQSAKTAKSLMHSMSFAVRLNSQRSVSNLHATR